MVVIDQVAGQRIAVSAAVQPLMRSRVGSLAPEHAEEPNQAG